MWLRPIGFVARLTCSIIRNPVNYIRNPWDTVAGPYLETVFNTIVESGGLIGRTALPIGAVEITIANTLEVVLDILAPGINGSLSGHSN